MSESSLSRPGVRFLLIGVMALLSAGVGSMLTNAAGSDGSSSFVPMTPCRLMDTRPGSQVGPRGTPIGVETYSALVWGTNGNCTIPASATAVSLNVTFVSPTAAGFVSVFPPDKPWPGTSNLNFTAGQAPAPNGVTSPLSFDGKIGFLNSAGTVHLIADIVGYYEQAGSAPGGIVSGECGAILRWDLPECKKATFPTGNGPRSVAFDGTNIWVTNQTGATVSRINPATGAKVDFSTGTAGANPAGVAFDGTSIWIANFGLNEVVKMNPTTGTKVSFSTGPGSGPNGVAFDGTSIWVTNFSLDKVVRINPATGAITGNFPTMNGPREMAYDGTNLWIANYNDDTLTKMDPVTGTKVDSLILDGPHGLAFDGTNIWLTNSLFDFVTRINVITGIRDDYAAGNEPMGIAFDGTNIWVANHTGGTVSKFNPVTGTRTDYPTGTYPTGVAFDGSNIWVANTGANTLSKFVV